MLLARPTVLREDITETSDLEVMGQYPTASFSVVHEVSETPAYRAVAVRTNRTVSPVRVGAELHAMSDDLPKFLTRNWNRPEVHEHLLSAPLSRWERMRRRLVQVVPHVQKVVLTQWKNVAMAALGVGLFLSILHPASPRTEVDGREVLLVPASPTMEASLTSAVADAALADVELSPPVPLFAVPGGGDVLALDMPKKPFKGQKRPPCKKDQDEIVGGCWVAVKKAPPCGDDYFENSDTCFAPMMVREDGTEAPRSISK